MQVKSFEDAKPVIAALKEQGVSGVFVWAGAPRLQLLRLQLPESAVAASCGWKIGVV
jgi:hypothetical protein